MTETCLKHLSFDALGGRSADDDKQLGTGLDNSPFLMYAAHKRGDHALEEQKGHGGHNLDVPRRPRSHCVPRPENVSAETKVDLVQPKHLREFGTLRGQELSAWCTFRRFDSRVAVRLMLSILSLGNSPLHRAAMMGHGDVARLLVERGASIDIACSRYDSTPLRVAA